MFCYFTSFFTVFPSNQEDVRVILKGYVQWTLVCQKKDFISINATYNVRSRLVVLGLTAL